MLQCPSCSNPLPAVGRVRFCPTCGFSIEGQAGRPGWVRDNIDLRAVAVRQRNILWLVLAQIAVYFLLLIFASSRSPWLALIPGAFYLASLVAVIVVIVQLMADLRIHMAYRVLAILLCFAPCANLLLLLIINARATTALQQAGLKVGFLGVPDEQVVRLLSSYGCRNCSYSLVGNTTGICPECGMPR